jgi:hypothetical protein
MASVNSFLNRFAEDFARPNRYMIEIPVPAAAGIPDSGGFLNSESTTGSVSSISNNLNFNGAVAIACHTCTMPGRTLMVYEHSQHSAPFKVPYSQQYDPITFSFYASKTLKARHFFEIWQTSVVNLNDNSMNFFEEYIRDVKIWQLDRAGNKTYGITLYGAWPISIGDIDLGYANSNQPMSINVTLAYKLWKSSNDTTEIIIE